MNRSTIPSRDAQFTDLALACKRIAFLEREVEFETEEFFHHEKIRLDMIFNLMDRAVLLMKKVDGLVEAMNGDPAPPSVSFREPSMYATAAWTRSRIG